MEAVSTEWKTPISETNNELTDMIDLVSPQEIVKTLRQADAQIFAGWRHYESLYDQIPQIEKMAAMIFAALQGDGNLQAKLNSIRFNHRVFWMWHKW